MSRTSGLAEVVIPPRSAFIGDTVFPGMVTDSGDLVIVAVQRKGEDMGPGEVVLAVGDVLLLQGPWTALDENLADPERARRRHARARPAPGRAARARARRRRSSSSRPWSSCSRPAIVPSVVAGLLAAGAMVLLRVVSVDGAYRAINWTTVVLVAGMIPLSTAMTATGAADLVADTLVGVVRSAGPYALLAGLFVITAVFGQLISNMATALIVIPIAVAAAAGARGLAAAGPHVGDRRGGRLVPDAGRDAREHDGHGPGRLPLRGLLEARAAAAAAVLRGGGLPRPGVLGVLRARRPPGDRRVWTRDETYFW